MVLASNIISPLGFTVEENLQAIMAGRTELRLYTGHWGLREPFVASLFTDRQRRELHIDGCTMFESIAIQSIRRVVRGLDIDIFSPRTLLILSTTKGNIERLEQNCNVHSAEELSPATAAQHICDAVGITTRPIVVCNACISGVNAQILASRLLQDGAYDNAIVCGAECLGPFVVSGFQSLKSVSQHPCRPFDLGRIGLNLGECAATIVYSSRGFRRVPEGAHDTGDFWTITGGAIRNDAMHITNPSPEGEGCMKAINLAVCDEDKAALTAVSVHGTATMFNDQMESRAIERAGLSDIPAFGLKGYLGHTMGANGVAETILTMAALDRGIVPATKGYEENGVSGRVSISGEARPSSGHDFLKIISGFGGNNAAIRYVKKADQAISDTREYDIRCSHTVEIMPDKLVLDGNRIEHEAIGDSILTEMYRRYVGNYPKFFKMDGLSRLAFIAAEMLLKPSETILEPTGTEPDAIVLFNHSSSTVSDHEHARLALCDKSGYASPSVFVYTLPNIAVGEIAIRHHLTGETALYILPDEDERLMEQIVRTSFHDPDTKTILTGWVDFENNRTFRAKLKIIHNTSL